MTSSHDPYDDSKPLPPGHYYVVDASDIVQNYLSCNPEFRRPDKLWQPSETDTHILDAELSILIPCLAEYSSVEDCLHDYCTHVREDTFDAIEPEIADDINGNPIIIPAIDDTVLLGYTSVLHHLGIELRDRLQENSLYRKDGSLVGEFKAICDNGLLILG